MKQEEKNISWDRNEKWHGTKKKKSWNNNKAWNKKVISMEQKRNNHGTKRINHAAKRK